MAIALSPAYSVTFYVDYGLIVGFPFPDWNGTFMLFLTLTKVSFTGLMGLPLVVVMALILSSIGLTLRKAGHGTTTWRFNESLAIKASFHEIRSQE